MDYINNILLFTLLIGQISFLAFYFIKSNKFDTNRNVAEDALGNHIKKLSDEFQHFRVITMRKIHSIEEQIGNSSSDWQDWKDEVITDKDNKWGGGELKTEDFNKIVDMIHTKKDTPLTKSGKPDKRYKNNK
jgi:hypothetical protein